MTAFMRQIYLLIAVVSFGLTAHADPHTSPELTPQAEAILQGGDYYITVWRDKSQDDKAINVFGAIDVEATPQTIWNVMIDCKRTMDIVARMSVCEVLQATPDGSWDIRRQKIKPGFLLPKITSVFRSDYDPPRTIQISLAGGDMKVQEGVWTLTPLENGKTRIYYQARLRPKFPVPNGLLKRGRHAQRCAANSKEFAHASATRSGKTVKPAMNVSKGEVIVRR